MRDPLAIDDLYAEHWQYVLALLPSYRIPGPDVEDVAQTVWMHIHRRRDSYDAATHKTRRAWVTGFVERCAANHHRSARRRGLTPIEDPGALLPAPGLDPEQAAIVRDLHRLIPNDDQRVALLLQVRHGLTLDEIAAVQEATESAVEWRLNMARKALKSGDDDEAKSCAFLGFGSIEALTEALKPKPIPPEEGVRQWERIAERIRQEEASPNDTDPPSSFPPAVALPALLSPTLPALVMIGKVQLAGLLVLAFMSGAGAGVGGVLAWQAHEADRHGRPTPALDAAPTPCPAAPSSAPAASTAPSTSTRPAASTAPSEHASLRLLGLMREAMHRRQFSAVLDLAEQHAQQFGAARVREREALRIEALRQTGRTKDAEQHARAVLTNHPEHRHAMERAAGHALP